MKIDKLNILITEDLISYAQGLELLLLQNSKVNSVVCAINYLETFNILQTNNIDIIILDLCFDTNKYDGLKIATEIRSLYSHVKIIILSQTVRVYLYKTIFDNKLADAYLSKKLGIEELYSAIDKVSKNEQYIDQDVTDTLEIEEWIKVSPREQDILKHLLTGLKNHEIAIALFISKKTVEKHIENMFRKFNVKSRAGLVRKHLLYNNANRENIEESLPPFKNLNSDVY